MKIPKINKTTNLNIKEATFFHIEVSFTCEEINSAALLVFKIANLFLKKMRSFNFVPYISFS
ncbi:Uncharacterised protein [Chlamydia trachomatis]|nr:Uncharacterised protein [Chlamydia trachomatis]